MVEVASLVALLALVLPLRAEPREKCRQVPVVEGCAGEPTPFSPVLWGEGSGARVSDVSAPSRGERGEPDEKLHLPGRSVVEPSDFLSGNFADNLYLVCGRQPAGPASVPMIPTPAALALECGCAKSRDEEIVGQDAFWRGRTFLEANVGTYFSQRGLGPKTPTFDFMPINLRLGVVLNDPCLPGFLRGSFETLAEFSTAPVVSGFGDIVVGPTALLRYNWVQPNSRLVPYLQGGAGFAYNNAYQDRNQHAIGQAIEFTLKAAAGCHYFVNDRVSVDLEGGFTHISNADLASRNLGINAVGGSIGITVYFPCGRR